jgi:hypothetical protein
MHLGEEGIGLQITLRQAVGIFARTFAAMAGAALVAAQGYAWTTSAEYRANALLIGLALAAAFVASLLAVAVAAIASPSPSRIGRAVRAFLEKLVAGVGVVAFNSVQDVVAFGKLLPTVLTACVLAFGVTWLTYAETPQPGTAGAGVDPNG